MEAWTASRKCVCLPTLSDKFDLDTETGEMVISVSNTSESMSIRDSYFEVGSCFVTDIMTVFMEIMKNTCE